MKKVLLSFVVCFLGVVHPLLSQTAKIFCTKTSPQFNYAASALKKTLEESGYKLSSSAKPDYEIMLTLNSRLLGSEAFSVKSSGTQILIEGGDERGLIYGSLSVAEDIRNGIRLEKLQSRKEQPHYSLRAVKFDLPWDTYRHSYALDLHYQTCRDTAYWKAFLDMMAENRLNSLSLWNLHPYTFMIKPKNFPEASPFSDAELKEWKSLFNAIFRMAKERAIDTYIIPFNIFVSPEFSKAHNVGMDNLDHHFYVKGDTSALVKRYTRECVTQMLQEYPDITGMGLTLGEGMGEMTPQQREDWMRETIIEGMKLSGRKLKLVHRIPFSSTTSSLGITSIYTEKMTRKIIEEEGTFSFLQKPIYADLKYNWSHAHSTPKLIKVHGGKLYDTYFVPEPETYKITWTARNEDFFCLRWGVPSFVRQHIATNNQKYVGGYFIGSETYIPAKDYFTNPEIKVGWKYAFERQWLYYKIWGRLLYNPDMPDEIFQAEFTRRYGKAGEPLLKASSLAGSTPLRLASMFDFTFDLSFYSEGFMAIDDKVKRLEYISADRLINQPVTDPDYVSVKDYVDAIISGKQFTANRITPTVLSEMLEKDCSEALRLVENINTSKNVALMFEVADIKTWANLGLHFAEKLKGATALQTYRKNGGEQNKQEAVAHFEKALAYWDKVISITRPIYQNMPLVHLSEQNGVRTKENQYLEFHWEKLRPDVARDIETAKTSVPKP
jgi:hypothetical protein